MSVCTVWSVWHSFMACLRAHNSLLKEQTKLRTQRLTSTLLGKMMNSQSPTEYMSKGTISTYWIYEAAFYTEHWPFLPRLNVRWEDKLDELGQPQGRVTADSAGYWNSLCRAFWMPCSVHQDTRLQKAANKFDERGWSPASSYKRTGASCSDMCQNKDSRQNWTNNRIYLQLAQCRGKWLEMVNDGTMCV